MKSRPKLTENAMRVLEARYLRRDSQGKTIETPEDLFRRVARAIAQVEGEQSQDWEEQFFDLMHDLRFLPNSPTLMNAGLDDGQLSACFVLPVEDSISGIFDTLKNAALIHQSGGGTGFSFSRLRSRGSLLETSHGSASGPLAFMRVFDVATEAIEQGGVRRGANMGVLRIDHPDVLDFIRIKQSQSELTNFNVSVAATDEFMGRVRRDEKEALQVFNQIVEGAWKCGDPGLIFIDRMNRFNPTPKIGVFEATNPCGEQPLLDYESCNLGSMNLSRYVSSRSFDWEAFERDIRIATRFLDNVIDANVYPIEACREITLANRKIGLGLMGFADALIGLGVSYDSSLAGDWAERWMAKVAQIARETSAELAVEKGAFENWPGCLWETLGYPPLRNATVSTVAPTGTISMIAGVSSGIEPIFSAVFFRNVLSGSQLIEVHPAVEDLLDGVDLEKGSPDEVLSERLGDVWCPAWKVSLEGHLRVQAAAQRFSDSAVSKTINLPANATEADVRTAYLRAYELGCKGITIYRDQSRSKQVLETPEGELRSEVRCFTCE